MKKWPRWLLSSNDQAVLVHKNALVYIARMFSARMFSVFGFCETSETAKKTRHLIWTRSQPAMQARTPV